MSDIQRYNDAGYKDDYGDWIKANDFSRYKDAQVDAIEAKEKEISDDKTYISGLESIVKEQKKEIERLKETIHLLKSSANSERLNKSIKAIKDGETFERELLE